MTRFPHFVRTGGYRTKTTTNMRTAHESTTHVFISSSHSLNTIVSDFWFTYSTRLSLTTSQDFLHAVALGPGVGDCLSKCNCFFLRAQSILQSHVPNLTCLHSTLISSSTLGDCLSPTQARWQRLRLELLAPCLRSKPPSFCTLKSSLLRQTRDSCGCTLGPSLSTLLQDMGPREEVVTAPTIKTRVSPILQNNVQLE